MSYAAAAKPVISDTSFPKKTVSRGKPVGAHKPSHRDVTEAAAGLTVDYLHHIWKFCTKYEEPDGTAFYRLPGFMTAISMIGHEQASAVHQELLRFKSEARMALLAEGDNPSPLAKTREYDTRHSLL